MDTRRVFICGPSGGGKTYLNSHEIIPLLKKVDPKRYIIVADPYLYYPCRKRFENINDLFAFFEQDPFPKPEIYCVSFRQDLHWELTFKFVLALSEEVPVALVVDELNDFTNRYKTSNALEYFIRYGRNEGIDLIYCTQAPNDVHPAIIRNAKTFICFKQNTQKDLERLRSYSHIGDRVDELQGLGQYEYKVFPDGTKNFGL